MKSNLLEKILQNWQHAHHFVVRQRWLINPLNPSRKIHITFVARLTGSPT
jgi:hypothetical protein